VGSIQNELNDTVVSKNDLWIKLLSLCVTVLKVIRTGNYSSLKTSLTFLEASFEVIWDSTDKCRLLHRPMQHGGRYSFHSHMKFDAYTFLNCLCSKTAKVEWNLVWKKQRSTIRHPNGTWTGMFLVGGATFSSMHLLWQSTFNVKSCARNLVISWPNSIISPRNGYRLLSSPKRPNGLWGPTSPQSRVYLGLLSEGEVTRSRG